MKGWKDSRRGWATVDAYSRQLPTMTVTYA